MKHKPMKSINFRNILPKGSVLVFSLLILSIMLVTSLTILSSAVLDRKASLSTVSSARSFQVADSGVEEILYQIYKADHATLSALAGAITGATCSGSSITFPSAGGTSVVSLYQDETTLYAGGCSGTDWRDKVVKIKSEGTAGSTTRAVEVAVAAVGGLVTSCPAGWTMIGDSGKLATFCIETDDQPSADFTSASVTCSGINDATYGRAHICSHSEWYTACAHGSGLTDMTNNWEWVDIATDSASGISEGNGGCGNRTDNNNSNAVRCCLGAM